MTGGYLGDTFMRGPCLSRHAGEQVGVLSAGIGERVGAFFTPKGIAYFCVLRLADNRFRCISWWEWEYVQRQPLGIPF